MTVRLPYLMFVRLAGWMALLAGSGGVERAASGRVTSRVRLARQPVDANADAGDIVGKP